MSSDIKRILKPKRLTGVDTLKPELARHIAISVGLSVATGKNFLSLDWPKPRPHKVLFVTYRSMQLLEGLLMACFVGGVQPHAVKEHVTIHETSISLLDMKKVKAEGYDLLVLENSSIEYHDLYLRAAFEINCAVIVSYPLNIKNDNIYLFNGNVWGLVAQEVCA